MLQEQVTLPKGYIVRDSDRNSYVVEGLLGKGGFSAVYRVKERNNKQQVFALKEIIDPGKRERERFIFEWEVLKKLNHPALPEVYRVFEHQRLKRIYILMRYIDGPNLETLRKQQSNKQFSLSLVLALLDPVVAAVSYLHRQDPPVVHRDIKPANIIVPKGGDEAVLVDFSIAKEYVPNSTTTAVRHGSPGYAAPEQYGTGTSPRTDVYGLGATLYTLLTGAVPIDALVRLTSGKIDPLMPAHELVPIIPEEVSDILLRAMSLHSEERFEGIEQFWQELHAYTHQKEVMPLETALSGTLPLPDTPPMYEIEDITSASPQRKWAVLAISNRRIPLILLTFLLIVVLIAGILYTTLNYHRVAGILSSHSPTATHTVAAMRTATPSPPVNSPYPQLARLYNGTISDLSATSKTDLLLFDIQQQQDSIHGTFQGLGLTGPFEGTIDTSGHIHFIATIYSGSTTLVFDGVVKIGGVIAGNFVVENQGGQSTGEYGLWSATPPV